jgi:alpha-galactosidase
MLTNFKFKLYYNVDGVGAVAESSNEHFTLVGGYDKGYLKLTIEPKVKMELVHAEVVAKYNYRDDVRLFLNGYQSWTESREYLKTEKYIGLRTLSKLPFALKYSTISGDYRFKQYPKQAGIFHGYTYSYIRNGKEVALLGSFSEKNGFTIINFNTVEDTIVIEKDIEGKTIEKPYELYNMGVYVGDYDTVHENYFKDMRIKKPKLKHQNGYTSWYNYYSNINEKIIVRDIEGICRVQDKVNVFQIDDGYQTAVGDWLSVDGTKFPIGMKYIADKIHAKGFKAGLWLAPLNCQKSSKVAAEHADWLLKDEKGEPILSCIAWGGAYALDIYNKDCRAYIKKFMSEVVNVWGYDMVKLDFLYSACMFPRDNKTRGELMCDAVDFLRECVGAEKLILGCGVPLGPVFGKFDFCRIGSDAEIRFKDRPYVYFTNREIVSTKTAIKNTMFRRGLDGRAFVNDPDVFFLREYKKSLDSGEKKDIPLGYSWNEKVLLAEVNNTFGNILFTSDNVGEYCDLQLTELLRAYKPTARKIELVDYKGNDEVEVTYIEGAVRYLWKINMHTAENSKTEIK